MFLSFFLNNATISFICEKHQDTYFHLKWIQVRIPTNENKIACALK